MDYEEKLRLAKEALESGSYDTETIEYIFPELKESEDEKTRKEIINYFECQSRDEPCRKEIHNKWIAWLDNQKSVEWNEEEEAALQDALWCIEQARKQAKDENDMGTCWFAERWLKSLKPQNR